MNQPESPWIDVRDRLPDSDAGTVIVCNITIPQSAADTGQYWGHGRWVDTHDYGVGPSDIEVTHWMPFPKPPVSL